MFRDLAGKQGIEFDQNYDWVIKKAGGNPQKINQSQPVLPPPAAAQQKPTPVDLGNRRDAPAQMLPQVNNSGRRGNTADAFNLGKMTAEERKETRMMMGQVLMNQGRGGPATLQNAAANVLGSGAYKGGPPLTEDRRNTHGNLGGNGSGLPPSGYRGQSISYPRGGTGGPQGYSDPFSTNPVGYSYGNQVSGPKIATINVRVRNLNCLTVYFHRTTVSEYERTQHLKLINS